VGYLFMGGGLAVFKWPLLFNHGPWEVNAGAVEALLVGMSLLALLGLRYPVRMLPILLFEVTWKLIWLGVVALPLWLDNELTGANLEETNKVLWVLIVIAVLPWRYVVTQYLMAPGDPWRRSRQARPRGDARPGQPVPARGIAAGAELLTRHAAASRHRDRADR
jgi:hypothetical protein